MAHSSHDHHHHDSHSDDSTEMGIRYSLYIQIDLENVQCFNESAENSGRAVFKPWERRFTCDCVESDVDQELLFNIPFLSNIKLKGIIVMGGSGGVHPAKLRLFKNKPNFSFGDVTCPSDLEFEIQEDLNGTIEYPIPVVKFCSVTNLTLHFPTNFGDDKTVIYYIGLRGEYTPMQRQGIVLTNYELYPRAQDHALKEIKRVPEVL